MSDETGVPKGNQMRLATYKDEELLVMRSEALCALRHEEDRVRSQALRDGIALYELALAERGIRFVDTKWGAF